MPKKTEEGMSELENRLLLENERLTKENLERSEGSVAAFKELQQENAVYKELLLKVQEHIIEVDEDSWCCPLCGKRCPLDVDTRDYPHETFCVLYKAP